MADLQQEDHVVFVVSNSREKIDALVIALRSASVFARTPSIEIVEKIDDLMEIKKFDICAVLFELHIDELKQDFMDKLSLNVEKLRSSNLSSDLIFIGFGTGLTRETTRDFYVAGGLDFVFVDNDAFQIAFGVFGLLRRIKEKPGSYRTTIDPLRYGQIKIHGWQFLRDRSVQGPNGQRCKLTEKEWEYIKYLYNRDIKKEESVDFSAEYLGQSSRQNSLVYKIKKKIGSDFPIISLGSGTYGIRIDE